FAPYADTQRTIGEAFTDRYRWQQMRLRNIAHAGYFSSDRTIQEYADDIWGIKPLQ
ncbi:MAG: glycogen/starch/alpha-glucan phosphorylase, partial [Bacillus sp. (in: firmicutes)]